MASVPPQRPMPAPLLPKPPPQLTPYRNPYRTPPQFQAAPHSQTSSHIPPPDQQPPHNSGPFTFDGQSFHAWPPPQAIRTTTYNRDAQLLKNSKTQLSESELALIRRRDRQDISRKNRINWLDEQWGVRGWIPPDVQVGKTGRDPDPSREMVDALMRITALAQGRGIELHLLWAKGGALRNAVTQSTRRRPHLSGPIAKSVADGIEKGTILLVANDTGGGQPFPEVVNIPDDSESDESDDNGNDDDDNNDSNDNRNENIDDPDEAAHMPEDLGQDNAMTSRDLPSRNDSPRINSSTDRTMDTNTTPQMDEAVTPTTKKRRFEQISDGGNDQYGKYKSVVASADPEEIERLRYQAILDLEQAEAEKEAADFALGYFRGRGDQMQEVRQQSDTFVQNATNELDAEQSILPEDSTPSGTQNTSSQGVIAGVLTTTGKVFLHGINKLRDALLSAHSSSENHLAAEQHRKQHADAFEKLRAAKARMYALDRIKKARQMEEICNEMRDQRRKLRSLLEESDRRVAAVETLCAESFQTAEEENWASILLPQPRTSTRPI